MGPLALFYGALAAAIALFGWRSRCKDVGMIGCIQLVAWYISNGVNLNLVGLDLVQGFVAIDFLTVALLLLIEWRRPTGWKRFIIACIMAQDVAHAVQGWCGTEESLFLYRSVINALFLAQQVALVAVMVWPRLDESCDPGPRLRRRR